MILSDCGGCHHNHRHNSNKHSIWKEPQALVDYGVENAIYLVGSHTSLGWYVDAAGQRTLFTTEELTPAFKNENYIVWRKE